MQSSYSRGPACMLPAGALRRKGVPMAIDAVEERDWKLLLQEERGSCVSLLMPTYLSAGDLQQDRVRLRNLLREAKQHLDARGGSTEILRPARDLLAKRAFWKQQARSLAIFCAPDFFRCFRLPVDLGERVVVSDRFYLRPLAPLLVGGGRFYVLALSLHHVRLLEARNGELRRLQLEGVPLSFEEALGYEQYDRGVYSHTSSPSGLGRQSAIFHGHGDNDQEKLDKDILHYFQLVARGLEGVLEDPQAPMVLAAVEEHLPRYRSANRHPQLLEAGIVGSPERTSDRQLYEKAWEVVEPFFLARRDDALERYRDLKGSSRAASGMTDLMRAADQGRVDVLLLDDRTELWGTYDPTMAELEVHAEPEVGDEDLLDKAAFYTLSRGGSVFTVDSGTVPDGGPAAAILRY